MHAAGRDVCGVVRRTLRREGIELVTTDKITPTSRKDEVEEQPGEKGGVERVAALYTLTHFPVLMNNEIPRH